MKEKAFEVLKIFENNGYIAYIVGGYVRDYLIGKKTLEVYKTAIKANKAAKASVNLEKLAEKESHGTATMVDGKDTTITTYTTDKEINILQTPMKKKARATT